MLTHSHMVTSSHKKSINFLFDPVGRLFAKMGWSPNALTLLGLLLSLSACAYLVVTGNLTVFAIVIFFCAVFDGVDGAVARAMGKTTKFGAYLDAMCDRYVETVVLLCVAYVTGYWLVSMLLIMGVMLISYAKSRASMEVPIDNLEWPDLMEKGERNLAYWISLLVTRFVSFDIGGQEVFYWLLWIIAILVHLTVVQRMLRAKKFIETRSVSS